MRWRTVLAAVAWTASSCVCALKVPAEDVLRHLPRDVVCAVIATAAVDRALVDFLADCRVRLALYVGSPAGGASLAEALAAGAVLEAWEARAPLTAAQADALLAIVSDGRSLLLDAESQAAVLPWPLVLRSEALWRGLRPLRKSYAPAGPLHPHAAGRLPCACQHGAMLRRVCADPRTATGRSAAAAAFLCASVEADVLCVPAPGGGVLATRASPYVACEAAVRRCCVSAGHRFGDAYARVDAPRERSCDSIEAYLDLYSPLGGGAGGPELDDCSGWDFGTAESVAPSGAPVSDADGDAGSTGPVGDLQVGAARETLSPPGDSPAAQPVLAADAPLAQGDDASGDQDVGEPVARTDSKSPVPVRVPEARSAAASPARRPVQPHAKPRPRRGASVDWAADSGRVSGGDSPAAVTHYRLGASGGSGPPSPLVLSSSSDTSGSASSGEETHSPDSEAPWWFDAALCGLPADVEASLRAALATHPAELALLSVLWSTADAGAAWAQAAALVRRARTSLPDVPEAWLRALGLMARASAQLAVGVDVWGAAGALVRGYCVLLGHTLLSVDAVPPYALTGDARPTVGGGRWEDAYVDPEPEGAGRARNHVGACRLSSRLRWADWDRPDNIPQVETATSQSHRVFAVTPAATISALGIHVSVWRGSGPAGAIDATCRTTSGRLAHVRVLAHHAAWDGAALLVALRLLEDAAGATESVDGRRAAACAASALAADYLRRFGDDWAPPYVLEELFGETGGRLLAAYLRAPCCAGRSAAMSAGAGTRNPRLLTGTGTVFAGVAALRRAAVVPRTDLMRPLPRWASDGASVLEARSPEGLFVLWVSLARDGLHWPVLPRPVALAYPGYRRAVYAETAPLLDRVTDDFLRLVPAIARVGASRGGADRAGAPHSLLEPGEADVSEFGGLLAAVLASIVSTSLATRSTPGILLHAGLWRLVYAADHFVARLLAHRTPCVQAEMRATAAFGAHPVARAAHLRPGGARLVLLLGAHVAAACAETGLLRAVPLRAMVALTCAAAARRADAGGADAAALGCAEPLGAVDDPVDLSFVIPRRSSRGPQ